MLDKYSQLFQNEKIVKPYSYCLKVEIICSDYFTDNSCLSIPILLPVILRFLGIRKHEL
jgi:hypothetical protein